MSTADPNEPISPDEILLRRIPEAQMGDDVGPSRPLPDGFGPHKTNDMDGLSIYRERFHTAQDVANFRTLGKNPTWVAKLRAESVIALGLTCSPDPRDPENGLPARPGHALIVEVNSEQYGSDKLEEWKRQLMNCVIEVEGPYASPITQQ